MALDDFTDSNTTALATHDSNWDEYDTTSGNISVYQIQSNALQINAWAIVGVAYSTSSEDSSEVIFKGIASTTKQLISIRNSISGLSRGYEAFFSSISGSDYTGVQVNRAGSWLGGYSGLTYDTSTDHTLKIVCSGTEGATVTVTVYVNDASLGNKTDNNGLAVGSPGFRGNGYGSTAILFDSWTDGVAAGGTTVTKAGSITPAGAPSRHFDGFRSAQGSL